MSFLSLYRKYRPENFDDLIGQDQVKITLKNALKNDRVAHAYLFAGPRGTGKTSTAKVFAKSLNCANPGADFEPCGECNSCQRIKKGNSLDVIEIDAASNRGIDEIRELREKVKFYPGEGKYKVYIIDEVHMLTKGAFNALLKTLEEPPDSVVFILATTEPHEVITTIMSRCQRFDFTLLTLTDLKKRLQYIAEAEGYEIGKEALDILARSARGGMRDAISLLDQAISFSDGQLSVDEISRMLGRIDKSDLKDFLLHISSEESQQALELLNKQLEAGLGIERFSDELIEYCRELLLVKECGIDSGILEYSRSYLEEIASVAANLSTKRTTQIIDEFAALKQKLRSSARPRLQLEISVIKLSSRGSSDGSLEARLSELEFKIDSFLNSGGDSVENNRSDFKEKIEVQKTTAEKPAAAASSKESPQKADAAGGTVSLNQVKENWARVLNETRQLDVSVQALLREGAPAAVEGKKIIIAFPESKKFHYKGAASNKAMVARVLRNILNEAVEIEFRLGAKKKVSRVVSDVDAGDAKNVELVEDSAPDRSKGVEVVEDSKPAADRRQNSGAEIDPAVEEADNFPNKAEESLKNNDQNLEAEEPASQSAEAAEKAGDLDIESLARIFSGEIIEVNQSILENRGGN